MRKRLVSLLVASFLFSLLFLPQELTAARPTRRCISLIVQLAQIQDLEEALEFIEGQEEKGLTPLEIEELEWSLLLSYDGLEAPSGRLDEIRSDLLKNGRNFAAAREHYNSEFFNLSYSFLSELWKGFVETVHAPHFYQEFYSGLTQLEELVTYRPEYFPKSERKRFIELFAHAKNPGLPPHLRLRVAEVYESLQGIKKNQPKDSSTAKNLFQNFSRYKSFPSSSAQLMEALDKVEDPSLLETSIQLLELFKENNPSLVLNYDFRSRLEKIMGGPSFYKAVQAKILLERKRNLEDLKTILLNLNQAIDRKDIVKTLEALSSLNEFRNPNQATGLLLGLNEAYLRFLKIEKKWAKKVLLDEGVLLEVTSKDDDRPYEAPAVLAIKDLFETTAHTQRLFLGQVNQYQKRFFSKNSDIQFVSSIKLVDEELEKSGLLTQ